METKVISNLAQARARKSKAIEAIKKLELDLYATAEFQNLATEKEIADKELADAESDFTQFALADFAATQEKQGEAHEIKQMSSVTIKNEAESVSWCKANFTPALSLNKKVFETAVKAGSIPAELATVETTPKVYIKSDLSAWLPKA